MYTTDKEIMPSFDVTEYHRLSLTEIRERRDALIEELEEGEALLSDPELQSHPHQDLLRSITEKSMIVIRERINELERLATLKGSPLV